MADGHAFRVLWQGVFRSVFAHQLEETKFCGRGNYGRNMSALSGCPMLAGAKSKTLRVNVGLLVRAQREP